MRKIELNDKTRKLNKTDWIIMGVMVLVYGILSFIRLGDLKGPNTYKTFHVSDEEVITLKDEMYINKMRYYTGNNIGEIIVSSSIDGKAFSDLTTIKIDSVFTWQEISVNESFKYLKFWSNEDGSTLGDVVLYDLHDTIIPVASEESPLTDEIDLVPDEISFMNSTYFDEIYHARTAYEYVNGIPCYEWTHPPLGKLIMSIPIAIFGFNPFTYRLMGNLFGILMIPIMYILAKRIFKNRKWSILAALIMMFDCFHFAHTRIALVDGFQVVFILLSVLFLKEYMDLSRKDSFKKKTIYLLLSGASIGCAIATKWNALYVGLGLAITFFIHLFKEYDVNVIKFLKENITINRILKFVTAFILIPFAVYFLAFMVFGKSASSTALMIYYFILGCIVLTRLFMFIFKDKYLKKLMFVCVISFIVVPVTIYILSYVLFPGISYYDGSLKGIVDMTNMMYGYHANLDATHPFSSSWYEWPIMSNPVWLYSGNTINGLKMTITDIGNPAVWWMGVVSFIFLVINSIKKKDKTSIFLLVFILSSFVPYVFIGRLMFMYHYFITLPFVMLGICAFIKWITEKTKNDKVYYGYIILIIFTFIVFYPVISGMPVSGDYVEALKWLPRWYF